MLHYTSDLKALSPTKAVEICAMNVQNVQLKYEKPPVHCLPMPPTPTPPPLLQSNAKLCYCHVRHGSVPSLCVSLKSSKTAVVFRWEKLAKVRNNS